MASRADQPRAREALQRGYIGALLTAGRLDRPRCVDGRGSPEPCCRRTDGAWDAGHAGPAPGWESPCGAPQTLGRTWPWPPSGWLLWLGYSRISLSSCQTWTQTGVDGLSPQVEEAELRTRAACDCLGPPFPPEGLPRLGPGVKHTACSWPCSLTGSVWRASTIAGTVLGAWSSVLQKQEGVTPGGLERKGVSPEGQPGGWEIGWVSWSLEPVLRAGAS